MGAAIGLVLTVGIVIPTAANAAPAVSAAVGALHQPTAGTVTSRIGDRCPGRDADHYGIDIANDAGTKIRAAYAGRVTFAGVQSGYGNVIYIRHRSGYETRYAHLSRFDVRVGQRVKRDQLIGRMGATGNVTGVHLHFEVRRHGDVVNLNDAYRCGQKVRASRPIKHNFPGLSN